MKRFCIFLSIDGLFLFKMMRVVHQATTTTTSLTASDIIDHSVDTMVVDADDDDVDVEDKSQEESESAEGGVDLIENQVKFF